MPLPWCTSKIHDRHTLQAMALQRVAGSDGHVVEEAEAHGPVPQAWWPGGRTAQKAFSSSPAITASVAAMARPQPAATRPRCGR